MACAIFFSKKISYRIKCFFFVSLDMFSHEMPAFMSAKSALSQKWVILCNSTSLVCHFIYHFFYKNSKIISDKIKINKYFFRANCDDRSQWWSRTCTSRKWCGVQMPNSGHVAKTCLCILVNFLKFNNLSIKSLP